MGQKHLFSIHFFIFLIIAFNSIAYGNTIHSTCFNSVTNFFSAHYKVLNKTKEPHEYLAEVKNYFPEIEKLSSEIDQLYPPDKYHLIFIGRSLILFDAFYRAQNKRPITTIPLSGLRHIGHSTYTKNEINRYYFPHFKKNLPDNLEGKEVVLLDYEQSGMSLIMAKIYLTRYFESLKMGDIVHGLGLKANPPPSINLGYSSKIYRRPLKLAISDHLDTSMIMGYFKNFSPYGQFYPPEMATLNPPFIDNSKLYNLLVAEMKDLIFLKNLKQSFN